MSTATPESTFPAPSDARTSEPARRAAGAGGRRAISARLALLAALVPQPVAGERVLVVEDDPRAADLAVAIVAAADRSEEPAVC